MDAFTFTASLDSKGRLTVPASLRRSLSLEEGSRLSVSIENTRKIERQVESFEEAAEIIRQLEDVKSFSYSGSFLEVVLDD
ncbi:MAG: AbrB/MazE/SpoVT family DNA-binding domain-containing protein [Candidatus Nanohaloarchaea archaeon]